MGVQETAQAKLKVLVRGPWGVTGCHDGPYLFEGEVTGEAPDSKPGDHRLTVAIPALNLAFSIPAGTVALSSDK